MRALTSRPHRKDRGCDRNSLARDPLVVCVAVGGAKHEHLEAARLLYHRRVIPDRILVAVLILQAQHRRIVPKRDRPRTQLVGHAHQGGADARREAVAHVQRRAGQRQRHAALAERALHWRALQRHATHHLLQLQRTAVAQPHCSIGASCLGTTEPPGRNGAAARGQTTARVDRRARLTDLPHRRAQHELQLQPRLLDGRVPLRVAQLHRHQHRLAPTHRVH
eukprot:scaffold12192_cov66-Phaeocystis_antarctica.AAC.2